jgi:hypothetical protein
MKYLIICIIILVISKNLKAQDENRPSREINMPPMEVTIHGHGMEKNGNQGAGATNIRTPANQSVTTLPTITLPLKPSEITITALKTLQARLNAINGIQVTLAGISLSELLTNPEELMMIITKGISSNDWANLAVAIKQVNSVKSEVIINEAIATSLKLDDAIKAKQEKQEDTKQLKLEQKFWDNLARTTNDAIITDNWKFYNDELPRLKMIHYDGQSHPDTSSGFFLDIRQDFVESTAGRQIGISIHPDIELDRCLNSDVLFILHGRYSSIDNFNTNGKIYEVLNVKQYHSKSGEDIPSISDTLFVNYSALVPFQQPRYYFSFYVDVFINDNWAGTSQKTYWNADIKFEDHGFGAY